MRSDDLSRYIHDCLALAENKQEYKTTRAYREMTRLIEEIRSMETSKKIDVALDDSEAERFMGL